MTGRRPDATRCFSFIDQFREKGVGSDWVSMPQHFRESGWFTVGAGKLFHPGLPPSFDAPKSWQRFIYPGSCSMTTNGWPVLNRTLAPQVTCPPASRCPSEAVVAGDSNHYCALNFSRLTVPLEDQVVLEAGKQLLRQAKAGLHERPFFVGVGFHKPHMPFEYPVENHDLYPLVKPPAHPLPPTGMPLVAWHEGNFNNSWDKPCPSPDVIAFRRAYYAAVTFTDSNIGSLLAELDDLGLTATTAVVVMGDHGWQLGELNLWRKMCGPFATTLPSHPDPASFPRRTNFELGVRVPLIIRAPWIPSSVGVKTPALAEAVDLFQTLAELAGLPALPAGQKLQGSSLVPILHDPPASGTGPKPYAFSQFAKKNDSSRELHRPEPWDVCTKCMHATIQYMGYSVRDDRWRFTQWVRWRPQEGLPAWDAIQGVELYDHDHDFGTSFDAASPTVNVAADPANAAVVERLRAAMLAQFNGDRHA